MFQNLYALVKNNAGTAVMDNPLVPEKDREAVINEASSSIIEVLKSQMETGRLKDLIKFFQFQGIYNSAIISSIIRKYANKLNKFYSIEPKAAMEISQSLIAPVMQELIKQSKSEQNKEFALGTFLSKLSGNRTDMNLILNQMKLA